MKLVIDSNRLKTDRLLTFLRESQSNMAVLTDFVAMEAYKGDTLTGIYKSMSVLSQHPQQVLVLKGTSKVLRLGGRSKGLQRRLVDESQTRQFPEFIKTLILGRHDPRAQRQLVERRRQAQEQYNNLLPCVEERRSLFQALVRSYSQEERAIIRNDEPYTDPMKRKFLETVLKATISMMRDVRGGYRVPSRDDFPNTFAFRLNVCDYALMISRGALGDSGDAKPETMMNDLVDTILAAYATYFDGIFSGDKGAIRIHEIASRVIAGCGGKVRSIAFG